MAAYYAAWPSGGGRAHGARAIAPRRVASRPLGDRCASVWCGLPWRRRRYARAAFDTRFASRPWTWGRGTPFSSRFPDGQTLPGGRRRRLDRRRLRHRRPRRRTGAAGAGAGPAGLRRGDARRSRPYRWRCGGGCVTSRLAKCGSGCRWRATRRTSMLQRRPGATRSGWRWLQRGDRMQLGEVELRVAPSAATGLGAAARQQRRLARDGGPLRSRVRAVDGRHLARGGVGSGRRDRSCCRPWCSSRLIMAAARPARCRSCCALRPAVVLVSAGRGNPYGHPARDVLARFARCGAQVFRTDRDGQIELITDGESLEVKTFTGLRWRWRGSERPALADGHDHD